MSAGADYGPPAVDLGGFGKRASAIPPPPLAAKQPQTKPEEPPAEHAPESLGPPRPSRTRRRASQAQEPQTPTVVDRKVQFFVHLPPDQHEWLRGQQRPGWPKREVVLEAFLNHREELRGHDPDAERRQQAGLPPRQPGRRKEVGGIPNNVYMGQAEAEVLDRHAAALGMSRSQMVTELLRLAAAEAAPKRRGREA